MSTQTVFKIIPLHWLSSEEKAKYKVGETLPKREWKKNLMKNPELIDKYEQERIAHYPNLPSRSSENSTFVFSKKEYAQRWSIKMFGTIKKYILLELSYEGKITWFDASYYDKEEQPSSYWKTASAEPFDDPLCEGILVGNATIVNMEQG